MGQVQSSLADNRQLNRTVSSGIFNKKNPTVEHQGLLKFRSVPFRGSVQISPSLFVEAVDYSLAGILAERLNTPRLLTEQDLTKLLETIVYTLAFLQSRGVCYKDLTPENIYYATTEGSFKLLPPELIEVSSYELMRQGQRFSFASPQFLIALRSQEQEMSEEIYQKANIFTLGMIMLEATTLRPSCDCYEESTLDILDKVVQERLQMVRQMYPPELAEIIKMMLNYSYLERMGPKELALLLNNYLSKGMTAVFFTKKNTYTKTHPKISNTQSSHVSNISGKTVNTPVNNPHVPLVSSHLEKSIVNEVPPARPRTVYRQLTPTKPTGEIPAEILNRSSQHSPQLIRRVIKQPGPIPFYQSNVSANSSMNYKTISKPPANPQVVNTQIKVIHPSQSLPLKQLPQKHPRDVYLESSYSPLKKQPRTQYKKLPEEDISMSRHTENRRYTYNKSPNLRPYSRLSQTTEVYHKDPYEFTDNRTSPLRQTTWQSKAMAESPIKERYHRFQAEASFDRDMAPPSFSNDQSISKIKEEIQKSRRLIQQFQQGSLTPI